MVFSYNSHLNAMEIKITLSRKRSCKGSINDIFFDFLQLTVNVFWLMTVSVVIYLGYRGKLLVISLYLAKILFGLLLKHFFHNGAASNQRLPTPKWKKLNDRKIKK